MTNAPKYPRYQDYVIKDGKLVGEFDRMYQDFDDPWDQTVRERYQSQKAVGINLLRRLGENPSCRRVLELGCGLGDYTARIAAAGLDAIGMDVSETAIEKARNRYSEIEFLTADITEFERIKSLRPDVIVMAEITWYILDHLRDFLKFLKKELPNTLVLHLLVTYPRGQQKYGADYFTDLDGIIQFFDMHVLEAGEARVRSGERRTWLLGSWNKAVAEAW